MGVEDAHAVEFLFEGVDCGGMGVDDVALVDAEAFEVGAGHVEGEKGGDGEHGGGIFDGG